MVERHRHLDESLEKLLFGLRGGAPDVFERLVRLKKGGPIEQLDPLTALLEFHATLWHKAARPKTSINTEFHSLTRRGYPLFNIKPGIKVVNN